jgi:hypothetical protein
VLDITDIWQAKHLMTVCCCPLFMDGGPLRERRLCLDITSSHCPSFWFGGDAPKDEVSGYVVG